jgi:hypothetical protein
MREWCDRLPEEIPDGAKLLNDVHAFLGRFVAYPSEHAQIAPALWIAHTHLTDCWDSTPRIAFLSPEPGSGKTRALEVSELLVPNPVEAVNVSPAYLFRKVADEAGAPTLLFDEIDTVFGPKAKDNEEIRGLLNAGHRKGAVAGRCVVRGKKVITEELPAYCAVAMAGLGYLPDTILTRSVVVNMRRRAPNETVEPYRRRLEVEKGEALRRRLEVWASTILERVRDEFPEMPDGITDRNADVWEALISIADAAGGEWPTRARVAAVALVALLRRGEGSLGIRLLTDIRTIFGDRDAIRTKDLLNALTNMEESVWADIRGRPLTDRSLAVRPRGYEISSKDVRVGEWHGKGYAREDFHDAWQRYLPQPPMEAATSATNGTTNHDANGLDDISHDERVELMMKHNGMTREQAEVERLRSGTKARLERGERIQCVLLSQQSFWRFSLNQRAQHPLHHFRARNLSSYAAPIY